MVEICGGADTYRSATKEKPSIRISAEHPPQSEKRNLRSGAENPTVFYRERTLEAMSLLGKPVEGCRATKPKPKDQQKENDDTKVTTTANPKYIAPPFLIPPHNPNFLITDLIEAARYYKICVNNEYPDYIFKQVMNEHWRY
jgi:hypothetical protein